MKTRLTGYVEAITHERAGVQEITVRVPGSDILRRALVLTQLTAPVTMGQTVTLNTVAVELGLGTGGFDFVLPSAETDAAEPPGHLLKLRYTPLQTPVLAVESPESAHHEILQNFGGLNGLPVVVMPLHSLLPAICAAAIQAAEISGGRKPRLVYLMTDGAALPLVFSRLVAELRTRGMLAATITAGQAFGGDYEAINLYSGLAAAKDVANGDIILVGQGPGNAGTDTPLGFSGIEAGAAINAVAALGGTPIFVPRLSFAENRARHYGVSHHTRTILAHIALARAIVPIPRLPEAQYAEVFAALQAHGIAEKHTLTTVDADAGLAALEATGLKVTTMGRDMTQERAFFLAGAAGGIVAMAVKKQRDLLHQAESR